MIDFIKQHKIRYGEVEKISPLINRITANNPGPFTYTGTGTYLIGHKQIALIDPGPDEIEHEQAIIKALNGKMLKYILLTHHHLDHSALAPKLAKKFSCKIYAKKPKPINSDFAEIKLEEGCDENFAPDIEIDDGMVFSGDSWHLMALYTPGHTSNHVCFALVEENTLFSGDHIMGWATSVVIPPDGNMRDYLNSLEKVKQIGFERILPTHGPAIETPEPFIRSYIEHRYEREEQIINALQAGHVTIPEIVKHIYTQIDKRLYPAAGISVLSHLIKLVHEKRVVTNAPPSLNSIFTLNL